MNQNHIAKQKLSKEKENKEDNSSSSTIATWTRGTVCHRDNSVIMDIGRTNGWGKGKGRGI